MIFFIVIVVFIIQCTISLIPIEAGTISVVHPLPQSINVTLMTQIQQLQQATAIASITEFFITQMSFFQFTYKLHKNQGIIEFNFESLMKVPSVSVDYMICNDVVVYVINMTLFNWHINWQLKQSQQFPDLVLFTNGFSHLNLTGNVSYTYLRDVSFFSIHFYCSNGDTPNDGWGQNFILYTIVVSQKKSCEKCSVLQKYHLNEDYILQGYKSIGIFYGFKGYTGNRFKGQFIINEQDNVTFIFDAQTSQFHNPWQYGLVGVPFYKNNNFIDHRVLIMKYSAAFYQKLKLGIAIFFILLSIVIIIITVIWVIKFNRRYIRRSFIFNEQNVVSSQKSKYNIRDTSQQLK